MPIFEQIHAFELIYLANHSGLFEKAEATFRRIVLGLGNGSEQRMDIDRLRDYLAELQRYESRTLARPRCMLACRPKTAAHSSNRMRAFWPFSWSTIMRFSITCPRLPNLPMDAAPVKECQDRAFHPCDHSSSHRSGLNSKATRRRDRITSHSLSHTFRTWLAIAGEPLLKDLGNSSATKVLSPRNGTAIWTRTDGGYITAVAAGFVTRGVVLVHTPQALITQNLPNQSAEDLVTTRVTSAVWRVS
jgi:hypothetical protein